PGVVAGLHVAEGSHVGRGERLLTLSSELESARLGATQAEVIRRLSELRLALLEERRQAERLLAQQQRTYAERLEALREELRQVERDIGVMEARVALADRNIEVNRGLRKQGFISEQQLQVIEGERLDHQAQLGSLRRERIALEREQAMLEGEQKDLPIKTRAQIASIERNMAAAEEELAQAEARREIVVTAPQEGTVASIFVERGGHATTSAPLLAIVPRGSRLEAHLYSPSRAVGFVRDGQQVLLRY